MAAGPDLHASSIRLDVQGWTKAVDVIVTALLNVASALLP
jgi:hypothetical protein